MFNLFYLFWGLLYLPKCTSHRSRRRSPECPSHAARSLESLEPLGQGPEYSACRPGTGWKRCPMVEVCEQKDDQGPSCPENLNCLYLVGG